MCIRDRLLTCFCYNCHLFKHFYFVFFNSLSFTCYHLDGTFQSKFPFKDKVSYLTNLLKIRREGWGRRGFEKESATAPEITNPQTPITINGYTSENVFGILNNWFRIFQRSIQLAQKKKETPQEKNKARR